MSAKAQAKVQQPSTPEAGKKLSLKARICAHLKANCDIYIVAVLVFVFPTAAAFATLRFGFSVDWWLVAIWTYVAVALLTFIPVWRAISRKVSEEDTKASLKKATTSIAEAKPKEELTKEVREAIRLNFERLSGTLVFWKFEAAKYKAAHYYCLFWTIPSAVLIPILTQASVGTPLGTMLVTVISAFTAILLAFHKGLKIEENYRAFRHGESEFYDLFRRILDRPAALAEKVDGRLDAYLVETETIRRFIRNSETNNMATLDEARLLLKGAKAKGDT